MNIMNRLPNEIINIILFYIGELNNSIIITQYHLNTNEKFYKINFNSVLLWRIKATLVMKRIYSLYSDISSIEKDNKILYEK